jgi:hypothetical protein
LADTPQVHRLLRTGSSHLAYFDLRFPATSVKKKASGHYTYLNHDDSWEPALTSQDHHIRLLAKELLPGTYIDITPQYKYPFVSVCDLLKVVAKICSAQVDPKRFVLDAIDPEVDGRLKRAFKRRVSKVRSRAPGEAEEAKARGYLNVDYLGSRCFFAGFTFAYGEDGNHWLILDTMREPR